MNIIPLEIGQPASRSNDKHRSILAVAYGSSGRICVGHGLELCKMAIVIDENGPHSQCLLHTSYIAVEYLTMVGFHKNC